MGDIWTMLYQDKNEAHLSLQGKELVFVSRQMERLLPFFHKEGCFNSLQETHTEIKSTWLKKVPKGARGKLWKSRVMQPFCLADQNDWDEELSYLYLYFPMDLMGTGIGSSLLQTIFLASQSWISQRYQWKKSEWISWNVCHFGDLSYQNTIL